MAQEPRMSRDLRHAVVRAGQARCGHAALQLIQPAVTILARPSATARRRVPLSQAPPFQHEGRFRELIDTACPGGTMKQANLGLALLGALVVTGLYALALFGLEAGWELQQTIADLGMVGAGLAAGGAALWTASRGCGVLAGPGC